jgi:hypothetical protein
MYREWQKPAGQEASEGFQPSLDYLHDQARRLLEAARESVRSAKRLRPSPVV